MRKGGETPSERRYREKGEDALFAALLCCEVAVRTAERGGGEDETQDKATTNGLDGART